MSVPDEHLSLQQVGMALVRNAASLPVVVRNAVRMRRLRRTDEISIGAVLQRRAAAHPGRPFLRFEGTDVYTYGEANAEVNRYAAVLADRGVGAGDVVAVLGRNRPETLVTMLAIVKLGAVAGMLNHNHRGEVLDQALGLLDAKMLVVGTECLDVLASLPEAPAIPTLLLGGAGDEPPAADPDSDLLALCAVAPAADPDVTEHLPASTTAYYIFTSGTTGMPKASAMTHYRWLKSMYGLTGLGLRLRGDDTIYCCLPLYHNNAATVALSAALGPGATFALGRSFSASRFWHEVIRDRATSFVYIGEILRYLLNRPPAPRDRAHRVRAVVGNGLRPEIWDEFEDRFGIPRVAEFYGASEGNIAFVNGLNLPRTAGLSPLPYAVVAHDPETGGPARDASGRAREVGRGKVGLLLTKVTERSPFEGYTDPEATERKLVRDVLAPGDCWFDTGDLVLDQGFRHVAFVDRLGDTFRWKGENVATTQVEGAVAALPAIDQAVCYGVAVPGTDGRAGMVAVTLHDGAGLDPAKLAAHVREQLPSYAVPLFVRVVDHLETTSTFKARKVDLREQGYGPQVSDPLYVLVDSGYVPAYPGYAEEVAAGRGHRPPA